MMRRSKLFRKESRWFNLFKRVWIFGFVTFILIVLKLNDYLFSEFKSVFIERTSEASPTLTIAFYPRRPLKDAGQSRSCTRNQYKVIQDIENADVLLVTIGTETTSTLVNMKSRHKKGQIWIYYSPKPPSIQGPDRDRETISKYKKVQHLFEHTMTYRPNSNIPIHPFSVSKFEENDPKQNSYEQPNDKRLERKSRRIAWIPNRCSQSYDPFLNRLRQLLDVDVIGPCSMGYGPCHKEDLSNISSKCSDFLKANYLFVLVADEYFCDHYLSPDVVKIITMELVPIVVSGYEKLVHLPEGSFITFPGNNADHFADQIIKIQGLPSAELFEKFFSWRKKSEVKKVDVLCRLSNMINRVPHKSDEDQDWVTEEFRCYPDWISYGGRKFLGRNLYFL